MAKQMTEAEKQKQKWMLERTQARRQRKTRWSMYTADEVEHILGKMEEEVTELLEEYSGTAPIVERVYHVFSDWTDDRCWMCAQDMVLDGEGESATAHVCRHCNGDLD